jgi:hypothetical protein
LKVVPQPDRSVSVRFAFSEQKLLQKVCEFPPQQIIVLKGFSASSGIHLSISGGSDREE